MVNHNFWSFFSHEIVLLLWCSLSKNCGRGWGCAGQNLRIVVVVGVVVVIFGKIVLGLGLGLSFLEKLCWGWGCQFSENCVGVGVVVLFPEKIVLWLWC